MRSFAQSEFELRFEWGPRGAEAVGAEARAIVVVDILRFTTTVVTAVERGAIVYPYRWRDDSAPAFADSIGATIAVRRQDATREHPYSLSPLSMTAANAGTKIVLPSPNGAEVSLAAARNGGAVFAGCLRNAQAVAVAARAVGTPIAIVAAGERWHLDGSLRPSFEDLMGAGAIIDALDGLRVSPEASAALAVFKSARDDLERLLLDCASGRELAGKGFTDDVIWAAKLNVSRVAPLLRDGAYLVS
jgi:2-phosphosulfolactate phosphatase